jgi:hypothetical protein
MHPVVVRVAEVGREETRTVATRLCWTKKKHCGSGRSCAKASNPGGHSCSKASNPDAMLVVVLDVGDEDLIRLR